MKETYTLGRIEGWKPESEHTYEGRYSVRSPNREMREVGIVGVMNLVDRNKRCGMTIEVDDDLLAFRNFLKPAGGNGQHK